MSSYFQQLDEWKAKQQIEPNPMVQRFGRLKGTLIDRTCGQCVHLIRVDRGSRSSVFKCVRRGNTRSEATDHRISWSACSLFADKVLK